MFLNPFVLRQPHTQNDVDINFLMYKYVKQQEYVLQPRFSLEDLNRDEGKARRLNVISANSVGTHGRPADLVINSPKAFSQSSVEDSSLFKIFNG
jgi:hypothetical protein